MNKKKKQLQWAINPVTGQMMFREVEQDVKDRTKKREYGTNFRSIKPTT